MIAKLSEAIVLTIIYGYPIINGNIRLHSSQVIKVIQNKILFIISILILSSISILIFF